MMVIILLLVYNLFPQHPWQYIQPSNILYFLLPLVSMPYKGALSWRFSIRTETVNHESGNVRMCVFLIHQMFECSYTFLPNCCCPQVPAHKDMFPILSKVATMRTFGWNTMASLHQYLTCRRRVTHPFCDEDISSRRDVHSWGSKWFPVNSCISVDIMFWRKKNRMQC